MNKNQLNAVKTFRFRRFARKSYSVFNSIHKAVTIGVLSGSALMSAHTASAEPIERTYVISSTDSIPLTELDEVVVTASRVDLPLSLSSKQVTIITREDIERAPVRSIDDLLTHVAGIDILQRGPHGVQADISLRGGTFDQTSILLNSVNLTNPHTGHYSFNIPVNLSDIERIEIVQGPSSMIYGAGAFSGAVNIITKKDDETNVFASIEGGMHGLFGSEVRGAYRHGSSLHIVSAGYKHSDGYIDNSDYDIVNLLYQSRFEANNSFLDIQMGINDKKQGANTFYSATYPNQFDDTRGVFASIRGESSGRFKIIPHIYWSRHYDEFQLIRDGTPDIPSWYSGHNYHRSDVFGMNLNMQYSSRLGITAFGGEFRNEGISSNILGKPLDKPIGRYTHGENRSNISYFLEHNFIFDKFTFSAGGLLNHNTSIIDKFDFYPSLNLSYRLRESVRLYASWNNATRMPTFTDLYYTTTTHMGNSRLEAERSEAFEAGVKYIHPIVNGNIAIFYMEGKNMIDWVKSSPDALWESKNHTKINTSGVEFNLSLNLEEWFGKEQPFHSLQAGYTHLRRGLVDDGMISNYALNHLRHKFTTSLHHNIFDKLSMLWNLRWQDRAGSYVQYVDLQPGEQVNFQPFVLLDLKAIYTLHRISIFANANNIFNTTYVDFGNIPQPGFWMSCGVNIRL